MMKTILISLLFISADLFASGGSHDSLLFDGAETYELPKSTECKIKLTVFNSVEITSFSLVKTLACGEISYEKKEVKNIVQKDMDIPVGSEITTGPDGFARIDLEDGSKILLSSNAKLIIEEDFCTRHPALRFMKGSLWTTVKHLLGAKGYEISTERCGGGVRGTEFEVTTDENKTTFKVYEGKVEVTPFMNDKTNKELIKAYERLIEDMQSGKVSPEEYEEKTIWWNSIMEGSGQFPKVMVEAGNMVDVTFEVSAPEPINTADNKWFEDPKFVN